MKSEFPSADEMRKQTLRKENERASLNTRIVKAKEKSEGCAQWI
jgi:hypothetical protein